MPAGELTSRRVLSDVSPKALALALESARTPIIRPPALSGIDTTSALIFLAYSAYLPYALLWSFKVWRLNAS